VQTSNFRKDRDWERFYKQTVGADINELRSLYPLKTLLIRIKRHQQEQIASQFLK
jgi:hypothetical protein